MTRKVNSYPKREILKGCCFVGGGGVLTPCKSCPIQFALSKKSEGMIFVGVPY